MSLIGVRKAPLLYKVPAAVSSGPTTVFSATLSGSDPGHHGETIGDRIASGNLAAATGTQARVTIGLATIVNDETVVAYIGQRAAAGDAFDATALRQLTGGDFGAGTYTHAAGTGSVVLTSDWVNLNEAYDSSKDYLVFAFFGGSGAVASTYRLSSTGNRTYYWAADIASVADKTSMVDNGEFINIVSMIEIQ